MIESGEGGVIYSHTRVYISLKQYISKGFNAEHQYMNIGPLVIDLSRL